MSEMAAQTKFVGKSLKRRKKGQGQPVKYRPSDYDGGYPWGARGRAKAEKANQPSGYLWRRGIRP